MIVYKITNKINQKKYVGQTTMPLEERWRQHCVRIYDRTRKSALAGAMRKYGKENFLIETLAVAKSIEELNVLESKYAQELNVYVPRGYNLKECGDGRGKQHESSILKRCKSYRVISPTGCIHEIKNLKKFCVENKLDHCHMYKVCSGVRDSHNGWTAKKLSKSPTLTNGILVETISGAYGTFRAFCKRHDLKSDSGIHQLVSGKIKTYKGWRLV